MPSSEEAYIVRVRRDAGDAVVENLRSRKRVHVADLAGVAEAIAGGSITRGHLSGQSLAASTPSAGETMDPICLALPLLPGEGEHARAFLRELDQGRRDDYDRSERRLSITKEVWFVATVGDQEAIVAYIEAEDFAAATERFSASRDPFDLWFKNELVRATGIDLNNPPELSLPELLSTYRASDGDSAAARSDRERS